MTTGAVGIEPTSMVLETTVLPLNYAPSQFCGYRKPPRLIIAYVGERRKEKFAESERKNYGKERETMLEQAGTMFDDMEAMMHHIKKKVYKERMEIFQTKNAGTLGEMTGFVENAQEKQAAAAQVAAALADAVENRFAKRGKISGRSQMDINLYMIYFVFPAILMTKSEYAEAVADAVRDEWRRRFRDSAQIDYTTFEDICGTFQEKIFGMF